ncbi:MAG: ribonuclease inhibitor [Verrucomicrobia bacterium]|nr:ribonuclease inhibitor [Verrucomicrobiota bacterium]
MPIATPPSVPEIVLFLGRFHPLLVHLPIGFLCLLGLLEALARFPRLKPLAHGRGVILGLTLAAAAFTAACGLMLAQAGGYDAALLQSHQWAGIAVAVGCLLASFTHWRGLTRAYYGSLIVTLAVLAVASHYGGSITHGRDYLTQYAPEPIRELLGEETAPAPAKVAVVEEAVVFTQVVQPILKAKCAGCHNADKLKGGLRVDTLEALLQGGQSGPVIEKGDAAKSRLVNYLHLPVTDDKHMPPAGKPQPTGDEMAVLAWWIDAGAPADKTVAELKPPARVTRALETMFGTAEPDMPPQKLADLQPGIEKLSAELSVSIAPLSQTEPWLACNASLNTNFGDAELAKLAPLKSNLRWLDLGGTKITDAGLAPVSELRNLTRLHLERTAVTDAGLACVAKLRNLEYLNLYGTATSDAGLQQLRRLAKLQKLYLWQTKVTPDAAKAFAADITDKQQLHRWRQEIEDIKAKIRTATLDINVGAQLPPAPAQVAAKPVNDKCPVTGKPVDLAKTVTHEGKVIAFCCDKCVACFQQNPKPLLAKLNLTPINAKCPVTGKDVDPAKTVSHEGKVIGFCCDKCVACFKQDPKPILTKLNLQAIATK